MIWTSAETPAVLISMQPVEGELEMAGPRFGSIVVVVVRKILDSLGLPSRPPPLAPARRNPQRTLTKF